MRVVGLTGGIGSGKSEVSKIFASLGADVIDADRLAREVVEPGMPALRAIVERFGAGVLDERGGLDRKKVASLVFKDEEKRAALNAIVHPAVSERALEMIAGFANAGSKLVVYDVPLLFETGLDRFFPEIVVVDVDAATQRARVRSRDGMTPEEIEDRIAAQMPLAEKVKRATWVIDNAGTREDTRAQVTRLFGELTGGQGDTGGDR